MAKPWILSDVLGFCCPQKKPAVDVNGNSHFVEVVKVTSAILHDWWVIFVGSVVISAVAINAILFVCRSKVVQDFFKHNKLLKYSVMRVRELFRVILFNKPRTIVIQDRDWAFQFPIQLPVKTSLGKLHMDKCDCGGNKQKIFLTTGGPMANIDLWKEHPLAMDGWMCKRCNELSFPRILTGDEVFFLMKEGARHANEGRFNEAELNFRRVANSWVLWAPARTRLAITYYQRARAEMVGESHPMAVKKLYEIAESQLRMALEGEEVELKGTVWYLVKTLLEQDAEHSALCVIDKVAALDSLSDDERSWLGELREFACSRAYIFERGFELIEPYIARASMDSIEDEAERKKILYGIDELRRYRRLNSGDWQSLWLIGIACRALGDLSNETEAFRGAYEIESNRREILHEYSFALLKANDYDKAEILIRRACDIEPSNVESIANLAVVLLLQNRIDDAEEAAMRSLEIDSHDSVSSYVIKAIRKIRDGARTPRSFADYYAGYWENETSRYKFL